MMIKYQKTIHLGVTSAYHITYRSGIPPIRTMTGGRRHPYDAKKYDVEFGRGAEEKKDRILEVFKGWWEISYPEPI